MNYAAVLQGVEQNLPRVVGVKALIFSEDHPRADSVLRFAALAVSRRSHCLAASEDGHSVLIRLCLLGLFESEPHVAGYFTAEVDGFFVVVH